MKRLLLAAAVPALLAGCAAVNDYRAPRVQMPDTSVPAPPPVPLAAPAPANGAIYQAAAYRPLFEDHRARLPGDVITVQIVERVTASQKSTSAIDKSGKVEASVSTLPLIGAGSIVGKLGAKGSSANTFAGKGSTESSNNFTGAITAVVTGVLPNGHLLIAGEKQVGVNANVDVLRFSGQVDPRAIQPGNTVASTHVANVRVEHRSQGQQGDAQLMGLLGRVFLSVLPF